MLVEDVVERLGVGGRITVRVALRDVVAVVSSVTVSLREAAADDDWDRDPAVVSESVMLPVASPVGVAPVTDRVVAINSVADHAAETLVENERVSVPLPLQAELAVRCVNDVVGVRAPVGEVVAVREGLAADKLDDWLRDLDMVPVALPVVLSDDDSVVE